MYLVYKHTTPSGKIYIGITGKNAKKRWKNGLGYQSSPYFWRAIQKYGWDSIKHEILHEGLTKEEACEYEKRYIEEYNATDRRYGYNQKSGGETGSLWNEEIRRKMSESRKKFFELHPEERKKHSEKLKNFYKLRQEERKKCPERILADKALYQARVRHLAEIREKRKRKVEQIGVDGSVIAVHDSISAAARETGLGAGSICNDCRGCTRTAGGYKWRYVSNDTDKEV